VFGGPLGILPADTILEGTPWKSYVAFNDLESSTPACWRDIIHVVFIVKLLAGVHPTSITLHI
jgi:hypothetical protein